MTAVYQVEFEIARYWWQNNTTVPRIGDGANGQYVGLCTASPGEDGTAAANEITAFTPGNRIFIDKDDWSAAAALEITHNVQVNFSPNGSAAATHLLLAPAINFAGAHDWYTPLAATVNFQSGDPLRIRTGNLKVNVDGLWGYQEGNRMLEQTLGFTNPANYNSTVYFALSTTAPNADGSNVTEPTVGAYARASRSSIASIFGSITGQSPTVVTSTSAITWPQATASWGTVTHWAAYDAASGGTFLYYGALDTPEEIINGLQPIFNTGDFSWTID